MMQVRGFNRFRKTLATLIACLCLAPPVQQLVDGQVDLCIHQGDHAVLALHWPWNGSVITTTSNPAVAGPSTNVSSADGVVLEARRPGDAMISTKFFGWIPWKTMEVHVVPREEVYLGGQSVGIRLWSRGPMVVGFQRLGSEPSPGAMARLQIGDVLVEINGRPVRTAVELRRILSSTDHSPLQLVVLRDGKRCKIQVEPSADSQGRARLGVFVRDRTAGVGTLTFYDPEHHKFGALGHIIADADTGEPIDGTGEVFRADIVSVVRGQAGRPGEKRGRFLHPDEALGRVERNTPFGVFGTMLRPPGTGAWHEKMPVALPDQVHEGPAKMYTVVHGERVEGFDIVIENVFHQDRPSTKSMVIRVTDPRLLREAGGIVQGMSGSPIVQDGRLVGAVTHVFVSDPTRGYGVYAEWMLKQAHPDTEQEAHAQFLAAQATPL
jgi:stage IV sporulation protein B